MNLGSETELGFGVLTQKQVVALFIAVIAVTCIMSFAKKALKVVLTVGVAVIACIYLGIVSPEQVKDLSVVAKEYGTEAFEQIAEASKNVKVDTTDGLSIDFCVDGKWYSTDDIKNYVKTEEGDFVVNVSGQEIRITDESIKKVLEMIKK